MRRPLSSGLDDHLSVSTPQLPDWTRIRLLLLDLGIPLDARDDLSSHATLSGVPAPIVRV